MSYTITASTTRDQLASFLNAEFSAIYQIAVQASSSVSTVISNICTVPSLLVNPPLYCLQLIPQLDKLYFLDLERSPASPTSLAKLLSGRLLIVSAMAASSLINSPLGSLLLCCQELAATLTTAELAIAALDASNLLSAFAADVQGAASDIAAAYQLAATTDSGEGVRRLCARR